MDEQPLFRSPFGGLWVDRRDAHEELARRRQAARYDDELARQLTRFIDDGYIVFERAVPTELCDAYQDFVEAAWRNPPATLWAHWKRQVVPLSMEIYDDVAKVSDMHYHFRDAGKLIYPEPVLRFLTAIYERAPVVFQTMTMRKGSEEELHNDTGPLTLTEPYGLAASWLALEDVDPKAGALQFVPGSHQEQVLVNGVSKGHDNDYVAYGRAIGEQLRRSRERGLETKHFLAKKGDVLIWANDLLHGGAKIEDQSRTRKSLVAHFTPHGAFPTFYDFSSVGCIRYPNGGYRLDRVVPFYEAPPAPKQEPRARSTFERLRDNKIVDRAGRALRAAVDELRR